CLLLAGNLCNVPMLPETKKGSYPCEGHGCGCRSAEDCLRHCCCHSHTPIKDECHGHYVAGTQPAPNIAGCQYTVSAKKYSFLRGLGCLGHPDKFSSLPNLIFPPQEDYILPTETPQGFTKETASLVLAQGCISPPERPPRYPLSA
ncbi:MAG: hypothetical protein ACK4WF_06220, partial [Candidatus Brocadiales bacterium]